MGGCPLIRVCPLIRSNTVYIYYPTRINNECSVRYDRRYGRLFPSTFQCSVINICPLIGRQTAVRNDRCANNVTDGTDLVDTRKE